MSRLEKLKQKAKALEAKDPKGAIDAWLEAVKAQESQAEPDPDLSIFNRVGDLYLKIKDAATAADYYDKAVDKYSERGLHNNAIAMCNKVLRNAPGRHTAYLKLAKLYAAKGFIAEATQNFVEYAERMQKTGKIQQAFSALKELTDILPESEHFRRMLEDHLETYGDAERRLTMRPGPAQPEAPVDPNVAGKRKTSSLIFLDVGEPPRSKAGPGAKAPASAPRHSPPRSPPLPPPGPQGRAPGPPPGSIIEDLVESVTADADRSLEIEPTSLADERDAAETGGALDGFETTSVEFDDREIAGGDAGGAGALPLMGDEADVVDEGPEEPASQEPDLLEEEVDRESLLDSEIGIEPLPAPPSPRPQPGVSRHPPASPPSRSPSRPAPPGASPPGRSKRKAVVEVPPLELEPDFNAAAARGRSEADEETLAPEDIPPTGGFADARTTEVDDIGAPDTLGFADIDATPSAAPGIEDLEARVADNPDDAEAHQALGEALIEAGDRARGIEELDHATMGFESLGELARAHALVDEILRLEPNSVRHRQKQVEFAFKSGDKGRLIDAYLELADALLRQDLPEKARAVYQRITEHDPTNRRAKAALAMFAPVAPAPPESKPTAKTDDKGGRVAPRDARMKVRDDAAGEGEFVDLAAMMLEEPDAVRDTRMKVADEEPSGDEERDFHEMLARFRQGIDENIDEADFESHYDLGVAFKEMGLLDEAIAEFQKALRAPEGKLKTSEALGACFFEKKAYVVAESILRRALELPGPGDEGRLGILYWLGRALEEQDKKVEARALYGRVFAVDIRFKDVGERARALARAK